MANSQMNGTHGNTSIHCGQTRVYDHNLFGILVDWFVFIVGFPLVCVACYALLNLLKRDKAAPIFVLNLLLADLILIWMATVFILSRFYDDALEILIKSRCIARMFSLMAVISCLGFMMLISAERYIMVACPLWYHTNNTAKFSILISACIWTFSVAYTTLDYLLLRETSISVSLFSVFCILPAPFVVGVFIATWRTLHKSIAMRNNNNNRKKVLTVLALILGAYMVLFLPHSIQNLYYSLKDDDATGTEDSVKDLFDVLTSALLHLCPIIHCFIYIFIRKDVRETFEAFPCCSKLMKLNESEERLRDASKRESVV